MENNALKPLLNALSEPIIFIDGTGAVLFMNQTAKLLAETNALARSRTNIFSIFPGMRDNIIFGDKQAQVYIGDSIYSVRSMALDAYAPNTRAVVLTPITPEAEENTLRLERQLETILESMHDGIYITDGNGTTLRVNTAYEKMCGVPRDDIIGRHVLELVEKGLFSESVAMPAIQSRKKITRMLYMRNYREIMVSATPVVDESGNVIMAVINIRDISELNRLQQELQRERALSSSLKGAKPFVSNSIVKSPAMLEVMTYAEKIAPYPTPVMLTGETGVGKEVIAHHIHKSSPRADMPFIGINCSAIPEHLLESELFGYEPGAFTGASKSGKSGILEVANGGTILLDEIGDMPLGLQVKLLRFLQEGEVVRLGGTRRKKLDVRVLSATHKKLADEIREGRFREDLFYRLNVLSISIPPLRERKEDILALSEFFLEKYCKNYSLTKIFSGNVLATFSRYAWPGNIRELKNLVENLVISTSETVISASHLPPYFFSAPENGTQGGVLRHAVDNLERELIQKALSMHKTGRKAAAYLGVDHVTLLRKMAKHGLSK